LTEIYLCHACSCHEIEDENGPDRADIVAHFGWGAVVTISSGGGYGLSGMAEFKAAARGRGLAIAQSHTFVGTDSVRVCVCERERKEGGEREGERGAPCVLATC
jgi:hypothetical protein